jgi:hypothetical protein
MQIRIGYELLYDCPQPTPMALMLTVRHTRAADLVVPDRLFTEPLVPICGLPRRVRQLVQSDRGAPIAGPLIPLDQKAPSATVFEARRYRPPGFEPAYHPASPFWRNDIGGQLRVAPRLELRERGGLVYSV